MSPFHTLIDADVAIASVNLIFRRYVAFVYWRSMTNLQTFLNIFSWSYTLEPVYLDYCHRLP